MKNFTPGLSDSIASVIADPSQCPYCESSSRIGGGLCVGCLLQAGLEPGDECAVETLASALAEITLPDKNWRLGNYEILEEIGRGGMGVIYRARQRHSRRIVAVKRVLSYHSDSRETLARFRREAQAAASLDHPNILPIYEVSESEDGLPFFSMKFAPGGSLQEAGRALRNEPRQCVALIAKVARAVQYAHGKGILHRDLKPGNILLDGRAEPLVSDFGLAKWLDTSSDLTRTLTIFGTPGYIAPEQASGPAAQLKPAADVYSLGAILFDLLAGRPPFLGSHALSVIRQASESPAPKLRSLSKLADRDLETICARCLEREPSARYHCAHDLAEDLERWLEGRPIIARPVLPPIRIWRWSRRNPILSVSLAAGIAAGVLAFGYEVRSQRLESALGLGALAQHSVAILPFLDLDEAEPDLSSAEAISEALRTGAVRLGPFKITPIRQLPPRWTGTGNESEVRAAGKQSDSRAVLAGTRRRIAGGMRYSVHLLNAETDEILQTWIFESSGAEGLSEKMTAEGVGPAIYRLLDQPKILRNSATPDPVMENDRARPFVIKGQELLYRRTISDMDRAVACFERAVKAEPRSVMARSYLALALMGRDLLSSTPELAARALRAAHETVELAPNDPTANRSVCAVATSNADYHQALEYGLRALEFGDQSDRAFGEIGYVWKMVGRPDRALRWFETARLSQHQRADYDALIGDCWAELGNDERARAEYESAAAFQPDQAEGFMGLCRLKLLANDYKGAREIYLRELPKYAQALNGRRMAAFIEFFARNFSEAERLYSNLASDDPMGGTKGGFYGAVDYRSALACLRIWAGRSDEARPVLLSCLAAEEERLTATPGDPAARYRKAAIEAMLRQDRQALADLRSAIAAGWVDYRATRADPRFDSLKQHPEFLELLSDIASKVAAMARHEPAAPLVQNTK
jgi:tetratricopeptide (TPR) repeat protein/tRNA A-37 threonylcarbamoyl transferase component Bud32/TolB-like protein